MNEHLAARHELITNMATLAREMLDDVDCSDWKWRNNYRDRLDKLAEGESIQEEKHAERNKRLKTLGKIISVFLTLVCICGAVVLWISVMAGAFQFLSGDIALKEFITRILGACAFSSPIVYAAIEGGHI